MKKRTRIHILVLLRTEFDNTFYKSTAKDCIDSAVDFAGEDHGTVKEMIADYYVEYDERYK